MWSGTPPLPDYGCGQRPELREAAHSWKVKKLFEI
jgi:hypothetical protein